MKAFFQQVQQDVYQLQVGGFTLIENGLVLVWVIFLVVFMFSWFASGSPSWMAGLGFLLTFFLYMELPNCRPTPPVPPPSPVTAAPVSQAPMRIPPTIPHNTPNPPPTTSSPAPLPALAPAPAPPPTVLTPRPSQTPLTSPVPTNSAVAPTVGSPNPAQVTVLQQIPAPVSRFEAILVARDGPQVDLRLYDTKTDGWFDDEIHTLASEPRIGAVITLGGVQATYVGDQKIPE